MPNAVPPPGFEGVEKKLEIDFSGFPADSEGLRAIRKETWDTILEHAKCTILNHKSNEDFTAYLLSESSLFVYKNKILLKTCGTTLCCMAAPHIVAAARAVCEGAQVEFVQFSRSSFIFPKEQLFPHTSFSTEVAYLNEVFETQGSAYTLGPIDGPSNWHIYIADFTSPDKPVHVEEEQTLEVLMYELDPAAMAHYFADPARPTKTASDLTTESGIRSLVGESAICDDFLFEPCGYSLNALDGHVHYTIHITPEEGHSFVSFETNLPVRHNYSEFIRSIVGVFRPGRFSFTVFADECAQGSRADVFHNAADVPGFVLKDQTLHKFAGTYKALTCSYLNTCKVDTPALQRAHRHQQSRVLEEAAAAEAAAEAAAVTPASPYPTSMSSASSDGKRFVSAFGASSSSASSDDGRDDTSAFSGCEMAPGFDVETVSHDYKVSRFMRAKIEEEELEESFFVVDLGHVKQRLGAFQRALPRVEAFFSVKTNPDPAVLMVLKRLGCGFNCWTRAELDAVCSLGATSLMFAPPCKMASQIKYARSRNVALLTFDTEAELVKIAKAHPGASLLLRVAPTEAGQAEQAQQHAFGATLAECGQLLAKAEELALSVVGVSCAHIDVAAPEAALEACAQVFAMAVDRGMDEMTLLDLGDCFPAEAFPGHSPLTLEEAADKMMPAIDGLFGQHVRIVGDASRYLVSGAATLAVNVFARRQIDSSSADKGFLYYVSDGVYGSFSFLHQKPDVPVTPIPLQTVGEGAEHFASTLFGPTCDGLDCISKKTLLPELAVGDWLYFPHMGCDAIAGASRFNGFKTSMVFYVASE